MPILCAGFALCWHCITREDTLSSETMREGRGSINNLGHTWSMGISCIRFTYEWPYLSRITRAREYTRYISPRELRRQSTGVVLPSYEYLYSIQSASEIVEYFTRYSEMLAELCTRIRWSRKNIIYEFDYWDPKILRAMYGHFWKLWEYGSYNFCHEVDTMVEKYQNECYGYLYYGHVMP